MVVTRWQAPIKPEIKMLKMLLEQEGLEPVEEVYAPQVKIQEHKHPFGEVRIVVSGELLFSISGNQFLLRAGDRLEVPANTKHWHINNAQESCVCIYAQRPF